MRFAVKTAKVRGQGRPRTTKTGHVYHDRKDDEARAEIVRAFLDQCQGFEPIPKGHPVAVYIDFYRKCPKSAKEGPDVYKPDIDNCTKLILDALNGLAWYDDCQVCFLAATKHDRKNRDEDIIEVELFETEGEE